MKRVDGIGRRVCNVFIGCDLFHQSSLNSLLRDALVDDDEDGGE